MPNTWPQGNLNGDKSYRELSSEEISFYALAFANGFQFLQAVPWGSGGYTKGRLDIAFTASAAATAMLRLGVRPVRSDGSYMFGAGVYVPLILPGLDLYNGANFLTIFWDDSMLPGGYMLSDSTGANIQSGALTLNPVWAGNADSFDFRVYNDDPAVTIQMTSVYAALRG